MRNEVVDDGPPEVADHPTFTMIEAPQGWRVQITWSDGEEGPTIAFASRKDAALWIERDADDWLSRLAASAPPRP